MSWVRFPSGKLEFYINLILLVAPWPGPLNGKVYQYNFLGVKVADAWSRLQIPRASTSWSPKILSRSCIGIALLLLNYRIINLVISKHPSLYFHLRIICSISPIFFVRPFKFALCLSSTDTVRKVILRGYVIY